MTIRTVESRPELRRFVRLPYTLYASDPMWVPPLRREAFGQVDPRRNPFLDHCDYALFLLDRNKEVVGRIAAFVDRNAVEYWGQPVGLFGYYECIDNMEASRLLLDAAETWLRKQGMTSMRGPWSFVTQEWGMVLEGFEPPPVMMAPYNPPYYNGHMEAYGLAKVKDLVVYAISGKEGYRIPERIMTVTDLIKERYGIRVREIDMSRYHEEARLFMEMSNGTIERNWGYTPVTPAEAQAMARDLKQVIQPKGALFAEDRDGRPIGFALAIPDINVVLKTMNGRLFPFGWLKLLTGLPRLRNYRMYALGVVPECHGKGVDSVIYRALYESLYTADIWMEINYVLEDNAPMNNAIRKLGARPLRRYRIYEKNLGETYVVNRKP